MEDLSKACKGPGKGKRNRYQCVVGPFPPVLGFVEATFYCLISEDGVYYNRKYIETA